MFPFQLPGTRQPMMPQNQPRVNPYFGKVPTPQEKMNFVNQAFGNPFIKDQQGTTRVIIDALPLDGRTQFQFFKNVNTRQFPFTNLTENKLEIQESLTIKTISFMILVTDPLNPLAVVAVVPFNAAGFTGLFAAQMEVKLNNSTVMKPTPLTTMQSNFNRAALFQEQDILHMRTNLTIPQQMQFEFDVQSPVYAPVANQFLMIQVEGDGALFSAKNNF